MRRISANYIFPIYTEPIENGILTISNDGKILDISKAENSKIDGNIEFYDGIICPGLVNTHCHLELSHMRNVIPKRTGLIRFITEVANHRHNTTPEEQLQSAQYYDNFMYKQGIVVVGDISNSDITFKLKHGSKIFYHTFAEVFSRDENEMDSVLYKHEHIIHQGKLLGLSISPAPHAPYSMCDKLFFAVKVAAEKYGILSYHNQETKAENDYFVNNSGEILNFYSKFEKPNNPKPTGKTAIHRLLQDINSKTKVILVHNTFTSEADYDFAGSITQNIYWALCPKSNLYIENTLPPIEMLRKKNAKITIGTDSLSSNTNLSIIEELFTISKKHPNITLNELLTWATFNGAQALGMEKYYGTFEKGKTPSIVFIDNIDMQKMMLTRKSCSKIIK